jgi:hypothetical protein
MIVEGMTVVRDVRESLRKYMLPSLHKVSTYSREQFHSRAALSLITLTDASINVAVRWRNGLPSRHVPGSIPGVAAMAEHFALSIDP